MISFNGLVGLDASTISVTQFIIVFLGTGISFEELKKLHTLLKVF